MKTTLFILLVVSAFLSLESCKKDNPSNSNQPVASPRFHMSPASASDPVDTIVGTYYGTKNDSTIVGPSPGGVGSYIITDTNYFDSIKIQKISTDSFKVISNTFQWFTDGSIMYNPIEYNASNTFTFSCSNLIFNPSNDSIRIVVFFSSTGSSGYHMWQQTFLGKK